MKKDRVKCLLLILLIILMGNFPLLFSQETSEQINGEPSEEQINGEPSEEQINGEPSEEQINGEPSEEQINGEPISEEQLPKDQNPLEERVNILETHLRELQTPQNGSIDESVNPFQIYALIIGITIVIAFVLAIFLNKRMVRQLRDEVEKIEKQSNEKLNESEQSIDSRLKHISQQGEKNTQTLAEYSSIHETYHSYLTQMQDSLSELGNSIEGINQELDHIKSDSDQKETDEEQPQQKIEDIILEAEIRLVELTDAYENGESFDSPEIADPRPSEKVVMRLNRIVQLIEDWKSELERSDTANIDLIESLRNANHDVKEKLKEVRGQAPRPLSMSQMLDFGTNSDIEAAKIYCHEHVSIYKGMLMVYQLRATMDTEGCEQFITQFIKEKLFNGISRYIPSASLPDQLSDLLEMGGYEIVPIEIGETEADARLHNIQSSQQTGVKSGTIAGVIKPGLQRIDDGSIIHKPVVISGSE